MGYSANATKSYQPVSAEVIGWRALADHAGRVATGQSHDMASLKDKAEAARKLTVFGPLGAGNVCVRLIEVALLACDSPRRAAYFPDLHRLAGEVGKRCDGWAVVRAGEVSRG